MAISVAGFRMAQLREIKFSAIASKLLHDLGLPTLGHRDFLAGVAGRC